MASTNRKTYPTLDVIKQNPKPQTQIFFSFLIARPHESLEGLNSFLPQFTAELWQAKVCLRWQVKPFVSLFCFCQKLVVLAIILAPDMLAKQSRTLKSRIIA